MSKWYKIGANGSVSRAAWETSPGLNALQSAVGGYVEHVQLDGKTHLWLNESGKLEGLPINKVATRVWEVFFGATDVIVGDVLLEVWGKTKANAAIVAEMETRANASGAEDTESFRDAVRRTKTQQICPICDAGDPTNIIARCEHLIPRDDVPKAYLRSEARKQARERSQT